MGLIAVLRPFAERTNGPIVGHQAETQDQRLPCPHTPGAQSEFMSYLGGGRGRRL